MKYFLFTKRANVVVNSMVQAVSDHLNLLCKSHLVTMKVFTFQGGAQISDSDIPCYICFLEIISDLGREFFFGSPGRRTIF